MTQDEIDGLLDHAHQAALAAADPEQEPGAILLSADSFIRLGMFPVRTPVAALGMFYRDVRVIVGIKREDGLLSRAEARARVNLTTFREFVTKADWMAQP